MSNFAERSAAHNARHDALTAAMRVEARRRASVNLAAYGIALAAITARWALHGRQSFDLPSAFVLLVGWALIRGVGNALITGWVATEVQRIKDRYPLP